MLLPERILITAVCATCLAALPPCRAADPGAPSAEQSPATEPATTPDSANEPGSDTAASRTETDALKDIPLGETFQGLRIPHMSPEGDLLMLFDARTATRVDDRHIEMDDLRIQINDEDGVFDVRMERSVFDLDTRVLSSDTAVKISREDFEIDGDGAEFHTRTRFGRVTGNVKMVIFNTDNLE